MLALPFRNLLKPKMANARSVDEVRLVTCHIDEPALAATLLRPEIALKGWLSFERPFDISLLDLTVRINDSIHSISLSDRPDVAAAHPELFTVGFERLLDLSAAIAHDCEDPQLAVELQVDFPGQPHRQSLAINVDAGAFHRSNYFKLNSSEHDQHLDGSVLSTEQQKSWQDLGYIVIKSFYSPQEIDEINAYMERLWATRQDLAAPVTVDQYIGTPQERRILFRDADDAVRQQPYKLNDLYLASDVIRKAVLDDRLNTLLASLLYAGTPMICSSLYFEKGSQQRKHFDTFFMPPLVKNRMLATWIALEDVSESSGPLGYFPGSHKIEPWIFSDGRYNLIPDEREDCYRYIDEQLRQREIDVEHFLAKKGDLFIWHPQLLHGGGAIADQQSTRRSLVTHYFCKQDHPTQDTVEFAPRRYFLNRDYFPPVSDRQT